MRGKYYWVGDLIANLFAFILQYAAFWGFILVTKFVHVLLGILFGWIIGWFLGPVILGILADIGIKGYTMWQIGGFLGFVGSFFGITNIHHKNPPQNTPKDQMSQRANFFH